jgi:hypothetical protein
LEIREGFQMEDQQKEDRRTVVKIFVLVWLLYLVLFLLYWFCWRTPDKKARPPNEESIPMGDVR